MAQFIIKELDDGEFYVAGTDGTGKDGETTLVSPAWEYVLLRRRHEEANEVFAEGVTEFYKSLLDKADEANRIAHPFADDDEYVITEGVEGVEAVKVKLDPNAKILKAIEEGKVDHLKWIGADRLVAFRV